jgi:translation initiation factor IF-2
VRPGVGTAATVLVQEGTMRMGDVVVCGPAFGRVRALVNDQGERVEEAPPATPVELVGLDEVPSAGDRFFVLDSLNRAKEAAEEVRENRRRDSLFKLQKPRSLEEIFSSQEEGETPELNLILRADVQGSVDVLTSTLGGIATDEVRVRILQAAVGPITEGDVILAEASDAIVIGFHVVAETGAQRLAEEKGVDIRLYRVIYDISNDIRRALEGMLEPDRKEETSGRVEVRNTFSVSKVGTIAGCYVVDGVVRRTDYVRLVREGRIIIPSEDDVERGRHRGIHSLKRFKDDAKEVRAGLECGIKIEDYDDVKVGDMIESYSVIEVSRKLS